MKKIFTFLLMALLALAGFKSWGQETLTVCNGTATHDHVPTYGYYVDYVFTTTQFLFPSSYLTDMNGKSITALKFFSSNAENAIFSSADWEIYFLEVDNASLEAFVSWDNMEKVASHASLSVTGSYETETLSLDDPYTYNGKNLLVGFKQITKSTTCPQFYWKGEQTANISSRYSTVDSEFSGYTSGYYFLPKTTFTYTGGSSCIAPTGLAASNITAEGATISWNNNGAESYNLDVNGTVYENVTSPYILDVELSTTYTVKVQAVCGEDETSAWSSAINFTTPDCWDGHTINYTLSDSYGDGWNGATLTIVDKSNNNTIKTLAVSNGSSTESGSLTLCSGTYDFVWHKGSFDSECSFSISENGETLFTCGTGSASYATGQVVYTLDLLEKFSITLTQPETGGTISANPSNAAAGTVIELTATPENGYGLSAWTVTNVTTSETITVTDNQFTMPESNVNVTATFVVAQKYTITCNNPAVGGTIHAECGGVTINEASEGITITLVAVPSTGCSLNYFTVDGAQIGGNTFTMPDHNVTVSAVFALEPQNLTVNDGVTTLQDLPFNTYYSDGSYTKSQFIIPSNDLINMFDGTITNLTFFNSYSSYFAFTGTWNVYMKEVDYTTIQNSDYFPTSEEDLVYAGTLSLNSGMLEIALTHPYTYSDGNLMLCFEQTSLGNATNNPTTWYGVTAQSDVCRTGYDYSSGGGYHYNYNFLPKTTFRYMPSANPPARYTITVNQTEGGSISASKTSVTEGTLISLTATPNYGYEFVEWNITPNVEITDNQFTMPGSNVTVSATFTTKQGHTVTITNPTDNAHTTAVLTATPNTEVIADDEVRLSYSNLAEGYKFVNYVATNASTSESIAIQQGWDSGSYSYFIMPNANVNLTANVKLIRTINVAEMQHGNLSISPNPQYQQIAAGETITITPYPDYGYELGTLTITEATSGNTITPEEQTDYYTTYTFEMPEDDVNIAATFVSTGTLYTVTLPEETEIGRVSAYPADEWESSTEYFENDNVRLDVYVKNSNYHIKDVVVKKDSDQTVVDFYEQSGDYYYFTMPADNVTVTATFEEKPRYTVNVPAFTGGTVTASETSVMANTTVYLDYAANDGYTFAGITVKKDSDQNEVSCWLWDDDTYYFVMPEGNVTVNAEFKQICNLTVCDSYSLNMYVPIYGYYVDMQSYLETQFILPKDILEEMIGGSINSLTFYANYSKDFGNASWDIFMQETNSSTLSDIVSYSGTPVYSGHLAIVSNQLVITLDNAYTYGGNNLLITFHKTSTGSCSTSNDKFYGISATNGSSGYKNGNFYKQSFLPKTTFSYTPAVKYNINYGSEITGGNITASPNPAAAGITVTLSATPNYGYEFEAWVENDDDIEIIDNQFTMPEHDVTISATFRELQKYTITCATIEHGTIHAEYDGVTISEAPAGTEITLVAEANPGYILDQFVVNGAPIVGNTYTMPDSEITISATFIPALTVYDNGGDEAQQRWPFYANYGNQFTKSNMIMPAADLTDMAGGTINSMKFYVQSFNTDPFYLCYSTWQVYLKEVSENKTTGPVDVTTATKVFEGVIDFKVSEITINFTEPFEYNGGNLLIATQNIDKTAWDQVYFYGEENSYGYVCSGGNNKITSLDDITSWMVTSKFLPKTTFYYTPGETRYNITVNQTEGGTISADKTLVPAGTEVTLSHEADDYHTFTTWVEDYDDITIVDNKFIMPEHDVEISATFTTKTLYNITITQSKMATIHAKYNDADITQAPAGFVIDLSYDDLQPGYTFDHWNVVYNGKIDVEVIDNQFTMPAADVTVSAVFSELTAHSVTIAAVEGGTISVSANEEPISSGTSVYAGTVLTFGNTPNKNAYNNPTYKFKHYVVTEEGQQAQHLGTGVNTYTMPNCNLTVSAEFEPLCFPTLNVTGYTTASVSLWAGSDHMYLHQVGGQYLPGVAAGEYVFINAEDIDGYRKTITWSDSQGTHEPILDLSFDNRPYFLMPADNNVTVSVQYTLIQKYNVTLDYNTEGGSITVSQSEQVAGGTLVHIYINTTNLHFSFNASALSVTYNEGLSSVEVTTVTEGSHYQFSMPEGNVTVYAAYTEDENYAVNIVKPEGCDFNVTYQSNGQNPTTSNVYCGYKVYLKDLAISSGYRFDGWNVTYKDSEENDQPVEVTEQFGQIYFVMPQGPVTITADVHELIAHNITVVQTTGGNITVNHSSAILGTEIYWNVTDIDEGFVHDGWIVTGSETTKYDSSVPGIVMPDEDIRVEAVFLKESIVNDGTSTNNIPINCYLATYYNTRSQFIINSNDLQDMYDASITDMTFFIQSTSSYSYTATWDVYLKEVDETEFASDAYVDVTEMTKVYTGTMTIADYKMKIHFDAPFTYTDKNLMVSFVQTTNSGDTDPSISDAWYGVYTQNSHVAYGTSGWEASSSTNFLPKTKFSYKPSETPTARYEIAINNPEGTTITASREVASAGTVITLTQETSSDYDFNNWNVTYSGGTVTVDENDQFTMPEGNVTVSANVTPKPHYAITLDEYMTNGTLTLSPESEIGYMEGVTVSISTNPETGYKFDEDYGVKAWKAGDPMTEVEVTTGYSGYNITMPAYNIVISARFTALTGYTITYHVNGVEDPETVYENEGINPSTPATPAGTSFIGWATNDIATYNTVAPELFETGSGVHPTTNMDLYAVFRYTDQSKWTPVYDESSLSTTGSDRVIFAYYDSYSGGDPRIMTYYDSWHFESATGEMNSTSEIVSIPANTTIFRPEKTDESWKFYFNYDSSETTLAAYDNQNIYPFGMSGYYEGTDTWTIEYGFVNCTYGYMGLRDNNTFNIENSKQARLYKEVKPEVTLDAYFTEVLSISGNEILNGNMTTRNLLINRGANYTVNGAKLTVLGFTKNVENLAENFVVTDGGQLEHYTDGVIATFQKDIKGYNSEESIGDGWYFIANPTANTTVNLSGGNSYDLYTFNPAAAAEWQNEQYENNILIPEGNIEISRKTGYLYANSNNHTLRFEGELIPSGEDQTIDLVYYEGGESGREFPGFNLVGNPFSCTAYISGDFDMYKLVNGSDVEISTDYTVAPCEAFFVEATEVGETVTLSTTAPEGKSRIMPIVVNSDRGETLDRAILHLEGTRNSHKFMMNPDRTNISFAKNGERFASVSRGDETEIPMNFTADHKGSYTISFNTENFEEEYLHLIDVVSGDNIDLLVTPSYTFEADADEYASRFRIVFGTTDINDDPATSSEPFVYISNGNLVINNVEGTASMQIVDMLGRIVRTETVCGSYNKPHNLKAGAYVITLDGRAQRIVIE